MLRDGNRRGRARVQTETSTTYTSSRGGCVKRRMERENGKGRTRKEWRRGTQSRARGEAETEGAHRRSHGKQTSLRAERGRRRVPSDRGQEPGLHSRELGMPERFLWRWGIFPAGEEALHPGREGRRGGRGAVWVCFPPRIFPLPCFSPAGGGVRGPAVGAARLPGEGPWGRQSGVTGCAESPLFPIPPSWRLILLPSPTGA